MAVKRKKISIMCPNCGRFLVKADESDGTIRKLKCKRCQKWIWFKPNDKYYREIREVPERTSASGTRFY